MKNSLLIISILIIISFLLCACDNNGDKKSSEGSNVGGEGTQTETVNTISETKLNDFYEKMVDELGIGRPLAQKDVIELYNLDENFENDIYCMINKNEGSYNEVFITQGLDNNEELLIKLATRVEAIRRDSENSDIKELIKDSKNVRLKEFRGFVILIVSNSAEELNDKLDRYILDNIE